MAEKLATLVVDIEGRIDKLERNMKRAENRGQKAANKITGMFKTMGAQIGAVFGAVALFAGVTKGVKAFIDLDKGMRRVNTVTRVSEAELKKLKHQVTALSTELGTPTSEMTGAMYDAVSAGIAVADVMEFMEIATKTAIGGFTDISIAGDALTTVMNSWTLQMSDANDIADILFKTVELGKTTIGELGTSLALVAPLASASGISFESLSIQLAALTAQGTPTAQAITQLKALIVSLKKQLGEGVFEQNNFADALRLGIQGYKDSGKTLTEYLGTQEAELAMLGLTGDKLDIVRQKTNQMGARFKAAGNAFDEAQKSIDKKIQNIITALTNSLFPVLEETIALVEEAFPKEKRVEFDLIIPLPLGGLFWDEKNIPALKLFRTELGRLREELELISPHRNLKLQIVSPLQELKAQIISPHAHIETERTIVAMEELGRTVKVINDEIAARQKLIDEGNILVSRKIELEAEILTLTKELSGEMDKQVESSRMLADNYIKIKDTLAFAAGTGGVTPTAADPLGIGGFPTAPAIDIEGLVTPSEIIAGYFDEIEESTNNVDQKFISILNAGASLSNILNIGAHTFVGVLLDGLNTANSIANSIFGIISAFTGGGAGGILGFLFSGGGGASKAFAHGGSFQDGKKIASFAGGVSGIVPPGFPNDSFPIMVQSGERVDITPTHKVGDTEAALKKISIGINNLIENSVVNQGRQKPIIIQSILDGKIVSESVYFDENRSAENSLHTEDFR